MKIKLYAYLLPIVFSCESSIAKEFDYLSKNIFLPEMTITSTRTEREIFQTPYAVNVINNREIIESNRATTPEILIGEEGILIQKSNTGGGSPFIRGLTGKQVLILIDGVRLNNSFYRFGPHQYLNTIDPNSIENIEIIRGPSSVLYGSDALGGVINIITKKRDLKDTTIGTSSYLALRAASADKSASSRAQYEHNSENLGVIGGFTLKRFDDLNGGGDIGIQDPSAYEEIDGDLKLSYRIFDNQEFVFSQQYVRQFDVPKTNEVVLGTKEKFNYEPQLRSLSYLEYNAIDLSNPLFNSTKLNLSYHRQKEGEEIVDSGTTAIETREITDVGTIGIIGQFTKQLGPSQRITYGFDYYDDSFDTSKKQLNSATGTIVAIAPGTPDEASYKSFGIYFQDEINFGDHLDIIPSVRYARFKADGQIGNQKLNLTAAKTTGSLSGLFRLTPNINLVGNISQGFRAPNMEDFFGRVDFINEIPNTLLKPEESLNREIGLKFSSRGTYADIYFYISDYDDLINRATVAPGVVQRQNLDSAVIKGMEASLKHKFSDKWEFRGAVSYTRGEDERSGEPLRRIPPFNGSAYLRYNALPNAWVELYSIYAQNQDRLSPGDKTDPRIPLGGTPGYATINLAGNYQFANGHELFLGIENIADKQYKTHGSGIYEPGINVIGSYALNF